MPCDLHDVRVRFVQTRALDAIERRLSTDPLRTAAIVDVAEAVRWADLDGGRPATLIRLGLVIDGLSRLLADNAVGLYPVAERGLLSDTELSSNERMVLRRWSDDGLVEVVPAGPPPLARAGEISALTGQPVVTRATFNGYALRAVAGSGAAALVPSGGAPRATRPPARRWLCPVPGCASFGGDPPRGYGPPPPTFVQGGTATCPRHGERLQDRGPQPGAVAVEVRVGNLARLRVTVREDAPVVVGRAPEEPGGVELADLLDEDAATWISRRHCRLSVHGDTLLATDLSTNGTAIPGRGRLRPGEPTPVAPHEAVELFEGVEVARAGARTQIDGDPSLRSVMSDAPTIAMRLPREM